MTPLPLISIVDVSDCSVINNVTPQTPRRATYTIAVDEAAEVMVFFMLYRVVHLFIIVALAGELVFYKTGELFQRCSIKTADMTTDKPPKRGFDLSL
ncbi:hypothetical protein DWU98_06535 [Dyella monticola]|uniref:Uncharacterized protein n=1 Tax=Dyella monticola TaxID=1927958 RepID=A0A370X314_9GAMM|nr:hypothetical protein DWU98_06535 [Dyella monticola]